MAYYLKVLSEENTNSPGEGGLKVRVLCDCPRTEKGFCWDPVAAPRPLS